MRTLQSLLNDYELRTATVSLTFARMMATEAYAYMLQALDSDTFPRHYIRTLPSPLPTERKELHDLLKWWAIIRQWLKGMADKRPDDYHQLINTIVPE